MTPPGKSDEFANASTEIQFPPLPLIYGDAVTAADGVTRRITSAAITITLDDGNPVELPLHYGLGGWWSPSPRELEPLLRPPVP